MLNFGGFWFGVWLLFLILVAIIPCIILGFIRKFSKKESLSDCIGYYMESWFQFVDRSFK